MGIRIDSRQKIMRAASELFHSFGYTGTSIDMLIENAGVSKSNFYYHFRSKEDLGLYIMKNLVSLYEQDVISETLLNSELAPPARLGSFYEKVISYHRFLANYRGCVFGNLALEQSNLNERFRFILSDFFGRWKEAVAKCIGDGKEKGFFREEIDPDATADLILSHVEGAILLSKTHKSMATLERSCKEITKLITKQGGKHHE